VPTVVKQYALEKYLENACQVHSLAFFQWRLFYHPRKAEFDQDMLRELCLSQIEFLYGDGINRKINIQIANKKLICTESYYERYQFAIKRG
jgi:hypothetical protein